MSNVEENVLQNIISAIEESCNTTLSPATIGRIHAELHTGIKRAQQEKELHRRISEDMLSGLQSIYREIAQVAASDSNKEASQPQSAEEASAIFHEASRQLDEIMATTLKAADDIMNLAEKIQIQQENICQIIKDLRKIPNTENFAGYLEKALEQNREAVTSIIVALSFQDLTGQRIKKVVQALTTIHQIVVETYVSAGLMLKKGVEEPEKDFEEIKEESRQQAAIAKGSELKGPTLDTSQKDVDDLLAQLGL